MVRWKHRVQFGEHDTEMRGPNVWDESAWHTFADLKSPNFKQYLYDEYVDFKIMSAWLRAVYSINIFNIRLQSCWWQSTKYITNDLLDFVFKSYIEQAKTLN